MKKNELPIEQAEDTTTPTALSSASVDDIIDTPFCYEHLSKRDVRSVVFHLLYSVDSFDYSISLADVTDTLNRGFSLDIPIHGYAYSVAQNIVDSREKLDEFITPLLINWRFDRVGLCTKLILRIAVWELMHTEEPHSIIINEAIELSKCFSEADAYKFINGILDESAKILRPQLQKLD